MNQWALAAIAVLLIGYGALSERLQCTTVTQAMAFIEATLTLVLFTYLDLWTAAALASILTPTDVADASTSHLGFRCTIHA